MTVSREGGRIRRMFADIAPRYDLLNHLLSLNRDVGWRREAVRGLELELAAKVLDVCTGTADVALELCRSLTGRGGGQVVGCDFTPEMLRIGAAKRRRRRVENLSLVVADTLRLPFAEGTFDGVTVAFGIRNVCGLERGLGEMLRVLRPGGRAAILEFSAAQGTWLHRAFRLYFHYLLPRLGGWISRSRSGREAYSYLPASVEDFPAPGEFVRILERCGFVEVRVRKLTLGIATLFVASRPAASRALRSPMAAGMAAP